MIADRPVSISRRLAPAASLLLALWLACWPCHTVAAPDPAIDLVLVLDNSQATASADPKRQLIALLDEMIGGLAPDTRIGLMAFDDLAAPLVPLTRLADGGAEQVSAALQTLGFAAGQSNSAAGLERAIYELKQATGTDARRVILLQQSAPIDVGDPEKDRAFRRWAVEVLAGKAADAGIELWVLSLGPGADLALGASLAERTAGIAVDSTTAGDLPRAIAPLRQRLVQADAVPGPAPTVAEVPLAAADAEPAAVTPPAINIESPPGPAPTVTDATIDPPPEPAQPQIRIDELDRLPEPAAGPVVTLTAAKKAAAGWTWPWDPDWDWNLQLPAFSLDQPLWRAAAIAALALVLISVVVGYARRLRRSDPPAAEAPANGARLIDVGGVTGRNTYPLSGKLARISRAPGPDTDNVVTVQIPEDVISRSHAFIELRQGAYWVTDPGSNNGTFVNGERVSGSRELKHGDSIAFASFEFRFEYPTGGAAVEAADDLAAPEGDLGDRTVAVGQAPGAGEAATTIYAGGGAGNRTTLAPQPAGQRKPDATGADTDQDPTIVRPAG